jgi:lipoprotein-anchoring transpeptidase ErfK/SrfK
MRQACLLAPPVSASTDRAGSRSPHFQMILVRLCFCIQIIVCSWLAAPTAHAVGQRPDMPIADQPGHIPDAADEELPAQLRRQVVFYRSTEAPGTIIVHTSERFLYVVQPNGRAIRYGIGVGRDGFQWQGLLSITRKQEWPDWTPPPEMIDRQPYLPRLMAGGPGNPLGARALYLGGTVYRIHGTNQPHTIGSAVSSGCFRLVNGDVIDLYDRIPVGTKVIVRQKPEL